MDSASQGSNREDEPDLTPQSFPVPPAPTEEELQLFYSRVEASGVRPAIFMVLPHYCKMFVPPCNREPQLFCNLSCPEARSEDLPALVSRSEMFLAELQVSEEMVNYVESSTRMQSKCPKWYAYRAGRITASVKKSVCCTSTDTPSVSLIKRICNPYKQKLSASATAWGLRHEFDALCSYARGRKKHHLNFSYSKTGVWLSTPNLVLTASPDALVQCRCCGKGTTEVKFPLSIVTVGLQAACSKTDFCFEHANANLHLKRTHSYYYQIQTQMAVCGASYCDFVVWSPTFIRIERVSRDDTFFQGVLPRAQKFFTDVILPELFEEYFTRKEMENPGKRTDAESFCY
ncbi:hypothetical protein HPB49_014737 [Dermacentor silvarum]|uniref:Uncharacterized protein n=1 Tax=Dermacentor silvarum TaxID=543639 RepID=A0ACB8D638_DERSI|nr:hypothetical protein HPB49_014737 [Dermacentor silvarum]